MIIYVVDDEPIALKRSVKIIQEVESEADVRGFGCAKAVFKQIIDSKEYPDVVFSDIEMPGMSGLEFAVRLKQLCPDTILIFVTAYSQYALDAFRIHVHGYILKPLTEERVREELEYALKVKEKNSSAEFVEDKTQSEGTKEGHVPGNLVDTEKTDGSVKKNESVETNNSYEINDFAGTINSIDSDDFRKINSKSNMNREEKLQVQCFGEFEVFWKSMPLMFSRGQTKELLAYLIYRKGAACKEEEIAGILWPEEADMNESRSRIRILTSDLKRILGSISREDLLIRRGGQIAIRKEEIDCDYYRMLAGDIDEVNAYHGEYMAQYSWAELDLTM